MKRLSTLILLLALALWSLPLYALTPKEIITKADNREDGDSSISEMTMILIDKKGNQRVRKMKGYSKDYGKDSKSIQFFLTPADVKNTAFLSFDYDDEAKEDDNWLYMPALSAVRRIAGGNKKDNFMGTDFTYHDMNGLNIEEWSYSMLKESAMVDGHECWIIGAVPRKDIAKQVVKDTGYIRRVAWIRKDNFVTVQGKTWLKKGKRTKVMKIKELELIQGIWTAKEMEMKTMDRSNRLEHTTIMKFENMEYNKGVDDSLFTTQRMEKGL